MTLEALYDVAADNNIRIVDFDLPHSETISMPVGNCYYIGIDRKKVKSIHDEKEKIAHESGHCIRNSFYTKLTKYESRKKIENRADAWAIKKLVPLNELKLAITKGLIELCELAEQFDVSYEFMNKVYYYYLRTEGLGLY